PINDSAYFYDFYQDDRAYYQANTIHMRNSMLGYDSTFHKVIQYGGLMTYMFHSVGTVGGWDYIGLNEFDAFLDTIKGHDRDIWVATFEQAIMYHREKKGGVLSTTSAPFANGNTWVLNLTDGLTDSIYDHELSIKLAISSPITGVIAAYQDSVAIPFQIVGDSIVFNAIPDGGDILFDVVNCVQPTDSITVTGATTFCTPGSVTIEAVLDTSYSYSWFKNGVAFGTDTNKIAISESGEFYGIISLNGCPNHTIKTTVTVTGACGVPVADFTANTVREFLNEEVTYTSTSTNTEGGETFYWDFGPGASLSPGFYGAGPIQVSYSTSGLKTVTLTATGSNGNTISAKTDYVEILATGGCGIYKEDFSGTLEQVVYGDNNDHFIYSVVNDAFRISTRDTIANEWNGIGWFFTETIDSVRQIKTIDFSDPLHSPVLRVRAKASDTCRLSFGLVDTSHTLTAGIELNKTEWLDVTTEYQEFEVDYSDLFFYEWSNPVYKLDSTQIYYIWMSINPGYKSWPFTNSFGQRIDHQFDGHVDIDWISIGEKCKMDSLNANIVVPDTVCSNQSFNVWNHSNPGLVDAQFNWTFDTIPSALDTTTNDELPLSISYSTVGMKTITLVLTNNSGKIDTVVEHVYVKKCDVGINDIGNQLTTSFVNPISSAISGKVVSEISQEASIILTDISGKIIVTDKVHFNAGSNNVYYGYLNLPSGIYLLTIYTVTGKQQIKLVATGN
ncbi:MAG: PKD repeat protein, partial [Glaciecola sp.]